MDKVRDKVLWAITGLAVVALSAATVWLARQAGTLERLRREMAVRATASGERILFLAAEEGDKLDLWAVPAAGGEATRLAENVEPRLLFGPGTPLSLIESGDERRLAFAQGPREAMRLVTLDLQSGQLRQLFAASDGWWLSSPSASPDGQRLAFVSHEPPAGERFSDDLPAALCVISEAEGQVEQKLEPVPIWTPLAWSPDGAWLAVSAGKVREAKMMLLPTKGGKPQTLPFARTWQVAWSPDGKSLVTVRHERGAGPRLVLWDVTEGRERSLPIHGTGLGAHPGFIHNPAWSPDGELLLYQAGMDWWDQRLYVVGREGGEPRELFAAEASAVTWARWSPDGEHIGFIVSRGGGPNMPPAEMDLYVVRPDGSDLWQVDERLEGLVQALAWSSDGRRLAFPLLSEGDEQPVWQLYIVDLEGREPQVLHEGLRGYNHPLWLPAPPGGE